jgi:chromosome partitioning protein
VTTAPAHEDVWAVLDRQYEQRASLDWKVDGPVVLAIDSEKGGVGKSGLAGGLVAVGAANGLRVCAIDLDPRATLTAELDALDTGDLSVNDLLYVDPKADIDDLPPLRGLAGDALRPAGEAWGGDAVQVLAAERALGNREMDATVNMEHRLHKALEGVVELFDLVVIDMPPRAGGKLVGSGLLAATHVIYPGTLDEDGLVGIQDARKTFRRMAETSPTVPVEVGVLRNIVSSKTKLAQLYNDKFMDAFGGLVMPAAVPRRVIRQEARAGNVPITVANSKDARELIAGYTAVLNHISQTTQTPQ